MDKTINLDSVDLYNKLYGLETLNPLVSILVNHIELLLNYCMRFYERQFATRTKANRDVLVRFERLLDEYFEGTHAEEDGLPTVKYCADKLCLSPNYFGDMFKKRVGCTPMNIVHKMSCN